MSKGSDKLRLGRFRIGGKGYGFEHRLHAMRLAQRHCVVLEISVLDYAQSYEIVAWSEHFDETDPYSDIPNYDCNLTQTIGGETAVTFKRRAP